MSEEGERPRFNPERFSLALAFFLFSAASFVIPEYAGLVAPLRWIAYAVGGVAFLVGFAGTAIEVGSVYKQGFLHALYLFVLLAVAAALHLITVSVPMPGWLVSGLRIFSYVLVLPWSILATLGLVRAINALPTTTSRTDAILTLLAFLGALIPPILASIFGTP